ncbi:MAG: DUF362 domain-containing protein [Nanoarchaeota archaeon]|nr:DUF362 domain-containing protein [Nanoarchaeota archaeon]
MEKEEVSVVKCKTYNNKLVAKALEDSLKNINFNFIPNQTILIKPNILSPTHPDKAVTTHPIILEELCKILKKHNSKILIGESSSHNTDEAFKTSQISKLSKYAKIINFESQDKKFFNLGEGELSKVPLPKILFDVDLIINVAKLKTHSLTTVTLSVKNLYGCVPGQLKEKYHRVLPLAKDFSKLLIGIENKIKPQLNIIDGVIGLEGEGPGPTGTPIKSGIILASKNSPALDIIASEKMGFNYKEIYTNIYSEINIKDIDIIGNGKNIQLNFKKPSHLMIPFFMYLSRLLPKPKIAYKYEKCTRCKTCEKKCPVKAISMTHSYEKKSNYPECDHKKCIMCLCCIEVCPEQTIYLQEPLLRKAAKSFYKLFKKLR